MFFTEAMEITTPYKGFTRYLIQNKKGADYMKSDMSKNFIFYEPMNKKNFKIFNNDEKDREEISKKWNHYVFDDTLYVCQNIEFINEEHIEEVDAIFDNPSHELAIFLQSITDEIISQNKDFEICIGVVHGKQITKEGIRYPHAHILLKRKDI
ncbi:MAG: hypothetical protein NC181_02080 [Clostridium sp.]|nr:hypothetical protein [Clostridium sp.]MCM1444095.1 hypothetical protein [Candidatus Amulumruptor caecigallinarius]